MKVLGSTSTGPAPARPATGAAAGGPKGRPTLRNKPLWFSRLTQKTVGVPLALKAGPIRNPFFMDNRLVEHSRFWNRLSTVQISAHCSGLQLKDPKFWQGDPKQASSLLTIMAIQPLCKSSAVTYGDHLLGGRETKNYLKVSLSQELLIFSQVRIPQQSTSIIKSQNLNIDI